MKSFIKRVHFDGLLYITNRVIAHIPMHSVRLWFYRRILKCEIGTNSLIFMDAWFDSKGKFRIGENSVINQKCRLDNRGGIYIGNSVSISAETCILTADHDVNSSDFAGRSRQVTIEDYVFIGTRAMILPGVTLGKGSVVAAGAIVTKNVDAFTFVAGVPAKPIRPRRQDVEYTCYYPRLFH